MSNIVTAKNTQVVQLDNYRREKYNVLVPTTTMTQISPFHKLRVEEVKIDSDPERGEVYKVGAKYVGKDEKSGEAIYEDVLALSKTALMKIASAAGIIWNWNETKPLAVSKDYVLYQAVGAFRKGSGEWLPLKCTKEIDLSVIEEETYEANLEKARKLSNSKYAEDKKKLNGMTPEQWASAQTKIAMLQWRKNKLMRAETGAMLRVIRALLSIKQHYSPSELEKPFIVPHVDFSPDYSDPEVRKMVLEHGLQATAALFGSTATSSSPHQLTAGQMQQLNQPFDADNYNFDDEPVDGDFIDTVDEPETTPEPEPVQTQELDRGSNQVPEEVCQDCGKKLSKAEIDYCLAYYDGFYCIAHQKKHRRVAE